MNNLEFIRCEISSNGVANLILNRPALRNAFNPQMIDEIISQLHALESDPKVLALLLSANGDHFCAGADLNWMREAAQYSRDENLADAAQLARLMSTLDRFPKPTLAKVQGAAYGGAVGLAACCDMVIASDNARFCLSEVKLGLIPAVISPYLARAIGPRQLRRFALSAEVIDSAQALQLGLVHQLVPLDQLGDASQQWLTAVICNAPQAMAACKTLIHCVANRELDQALIDHTANCIADIRSGDEAIEGLTAFLDKRAVNWQTNLIEGS